MTCEWEQYRDSTKEEREAVYSKIAFEYATNPKNLGDMENADGFACVTGPCGDTMQIWLKINDGSIADAAFKTNGCGNAIASCSMVTEMCTALDGLPKEGSHCALLAENTLKAAIEDYLRRRA